MTYAHMTLKGVHKKLILQILDTSLGFADIDPAIVEDSNTCGVIAPVFKLGKSVNKHRDCIPAAYVSNNTAHS